MPYRPLQPKTTACRHMIDHKIKIQKLHAYVTKCTYPPPPPSHPGEVWGIEGGYKGFWHLFVSEGVADLLFFVASVLSVGWGTSKVLIFVDERGLR